MIGTVASIFRSINSRLAGNQPFIIQKLLKLSYGFSALIHRLGLGRYDRFIIINNFDRNLKLKINTSWVMGFSIFWTGFHELRESIFLHKFLKPEMVLVDAGANMGEYSLFAGKRLVKGKVLSFEPMPKIATLLEENIRLNNLSNIQIFRYGLSDKEGVLPFHELDAKDGNEGLSTFFPGSKKVKQVMSAPLKAFDHEFDSYGITRIDFMKFDIEGGELSALRGAKQSIEKFKPLVMVEINDATYAAAGYSSQDIYNFFTAIAYLPYQIVGDGKLKAASPVVGMKNIIFKPA